MQRNVTSRALGLAIATVLVASCQALPFSTPLEEGRISNGSRTVKIASQSFVLRGADGKALSGLAVMIDGKVYTAGEDGQFSLPDSALRRAKEQGRLTVLARGYAPHVLVLGGAGGEVSLNPLISLGFPARIGAEGGSVRSADGSVTVALPAGLLAGSGTAVDLSSYVPAPVAGDRQTTERSTFLAAAGQGSSTACGAPLPCPPAVTSFGLQLAIDGPLTPGSLTVTYDLAAWLRGWDGRDPAPWTADPGAWTEAERANAQAAARILATFQALDATGDPVWRRTLESEYGLTLVGNQLTFRVSVGDQAVQEGLARVEVEGFGVLGVRLEVTILSAGLHRLPTPVTPATPPATLTQPNTDPLSLLPGATTVLTRLGIIPGVGVLIGGQSGIISDAGTSVVSTGSGGIISNNGGSLVGHVQAPFIPLVDGGEKYRLLAYVEQPFPAVANVTPVDLTDASIAPTVVVDAASDYRLTGLPDTPRVIFLRGQALGAQLRGVATAPGATEKRADLNAATTAITSWVLDEVRNGRATLDDIDMAGFAADVATITPLMSQAQAEFAVTNDVGPVAAQTRALFATAGLLPQWYDVQVLTFAGGTQGYMDATGAAARFSMPVGLTIDASDNLYVADGWNHVVRKISPAGVVTTFAGMGLGGGAGAGTSLGPVGVGQFVAPVWLTADAGGNLYVGNFGTDAAAPPSGFNDTIHLIRKADPSGVISAFAGSGPRGNVDGPRGTARFEMPCDMVADPGGTIYLVDRDAHCVKAISPAGVVTTIAGADQTGFVDGTGAAARFNTPAGIARAPNGDLFVADHGNHCIRRVTTAGVVTVFAGDGTAGFADGPAATARFVMPSGMTCDAAGNMYIVEIGAQRIRKITAAGDVSTIAGSGLVGGGDGGGKAATFTNPNDVAVDSQGNLFVSDSANHTIRKIVF